MTDDGATSNQHRLLHRAMRSILRPLARIAVARGLPLSALTQILKDVLVDAAEAELKRRGEKPTQSRISVLSGVHRKDVREFQSRTPDRESAREPVSRAESVVGPLAGRPAVPRCRRPAADPAAHRPGAQFRRASRRDQHRRAPAHPAR